MYKCPQCETPMQAKGELSDDGNTIFYQCPKCKNIELHTRQYTNGLRLSYP